MISPDVQEVRLLHVLLHLYDVVRQQLLYGYGDVRLDPLHSLGIYSLPHVTLELHPHILFEPIDHP